MLKLGFSREEALSMTEVDAEGYLTAYHEIVDPDSQGKKSKTYRVLKPGQTK